MYNVHIDMIQFFFHVMFLFMITYAYILSIFYFKFNT